MKNSVINAAKTQGTAPAAPLKFQKRIGSTTYVVAVHYNQNGKDTISDKILRLIESEAKKNA